MHEPTGLHDHEHRHADGTVHAHEHHHARGYDPAFRLHEHAHADAFEALAHISSPLSRMDARAKLLAALIVVLAVVLSPPLRLAEALFLAACLGGCVALGRLPLRRVLLRSAAVLPFAAPIALLAPLQSAGGSLNVGGLFGPGAAGGWLAAYAILSKAWVSAATVTLAVATTETPELLAGLRRLGVPTVLTTLLAFVARYAAALGEQLRSMRIALASRAPRLGRVKLATLYGHLAGAMFLRALDRGERIHAAMLCRGFDGTLPVRRSTRLGAAEALLLSCAALASAAIALY
ncbi:MAG: energy-coupling factor transporter transmembrane component T [Anaerosomatales bacterium]|nr:energy-coupling factor transporter transmembrane component T [Anaerosomatales bacterium]